MPNVRVPLVVAAAMLASVSSPALAIPEGPEYPSEAWTQREAENYAKVGEAPAEHEGDPNFQERWEQQSAFNAAEYALRGAQDPNWDSSQSLCNTYAQQCTGDPYLYPGHTDFFDEHGIIQDINFYDSQGARLTGRVWAPRGLEPGQQLPVIVQMSGSVQAVQPFYWWYTTEMVKNGYLVLTFDVRGQGRSDSQAAGGEFGTNINEEVFATNLMDGIDFMLSTPDQPYAQNDFETSGPGDTTKYNPFWHWVDPDRLGIAGHSLGAFGLSVVQTPEVWPGTCCEFNPVKAAVAWDYADSTFELAGIATKPRVPLLTQVSEYWLDPSPFSQPPEPEFHLSRAYDAWVEAGVPVVSQTIRGSSHYEWSQVPTFPATSWLAGGVGGWAEPFNTHYGIAWMDRWLKVCGEEGYDTADARMLDDAGWQDRHSFYFRSARNYPDRAGTDHVCGDIREGCSDPPASAPKKCTPPPNKGPVPATVTDDNNEPVYPSSAWFAREERNYRRTMEGPQEQSNNATFEARLQEQSALNIAELAARNAEDTDWRSEGNLCVSYAQECAGDPFLYPNVDSFYDEEGDVIPVQFYDRDGARLSGRVWAPKDAPKTNSLPAIVIETGSIQAPETLYWAFAQEWVKNGYVVMTFDVRGQGRSDTMTPDGTQGSNANSNVFASNLIDAIDFFFSDPVSVYPHNEVGTAKTTAFNPLWDVLDKDRLGIAGHSLGASGVSVVQAPVTWPGVSVAKNPVKVVVAWDSLNAGATLDGITAEPRVPAMGHTSEYGIFGTQKASPPAVDGHLRSYNAWVGANVPAFQLTIEGSTHFEWSQIPTFPTTPWGAGYRGGWGEPLVLHYSVAWTDRWLKVCGEQGYSTADARLLDDKEWVDRLSFYSHAARSFPDRNGVDHECINFRAGCADLRVSPDRRCRKPDAESPPRVFTRVATSGTGSTPTPNHTNNDNNNNNGVAAAAAAAGSSSTDPMSSSTAIALAVGGFAATAAVGVAVWGVRRHLAAKRQAQEDVARMQGEVDTAQV